MRKYGILVYVVNVSRSDSTFNRMDQSTKYLLFGIILQHCCSIVIFCNFISTGVIRKNPAVKDGLKRPFIDAEKPSSETRAILQNILHYEYDFYNFIQQRLKNLALCVL